MPITYMQVLNTLCLFNCYLKLMIEWECCKIIFSVTSVCDMQIILCVTDIFKTKNNIVKKKSRLNCKKIILSFMFF